MMQPHHFRTMSSHRFLRPSGRVPSALIALGFMATGSIAAAQTVVVLDDFSTSLLGTDYVQKTVGPFGAGGWFVAGGELQPDTTSAPVGGYGAWVWTANALQDVGDWFSVDIAVTSTAGDHNGGFSIWTSGTTMFDRLVEPRLSYNGGYAFIGSDQSSELWNENLVGGVINGPVTLKVTLTSQNGGDSSLRFDLSDSDGAIGPVNFYTVTGYTGPFYVGPSAWQAAGGNVAFDNLTYSTTSAVPEPSSYAALAGIAALALAWRTRRRRPAGRVELPEAQA